MSLEYKEKFRVNIYGEIEEVYINFFINQEIIRESKIGDIYFITINNGESNLTYSIHQNYYDKVQSSVRDYKLNKILKMDDKYNIRIGDIFHFNEKYKIKYGIDSYIFNISDKFIVTNLYDIGFSITNITKNDKISHFVDENMLRILKKV